MPLVKAIASEDRFSVTKSILNRYVCKDIWIKKIRIPANIKGTGPSPCPQLNR